MQAVAPYLTFNGNCEEAFHFYAQTLGGTIEAIFTHEGTPMAEHVPKDWLKKIMHVSMTIGGTRLMGSDAPPDQYEKPAGLSVSLSVDTAEEAERIYAALVERGAVIMPIQETFWATRFAMLVDRFLIPWMINCDKPM